MSSAKRIFAEAPSAADLAKLDQEDALAWTRGEFDIPNARACGGEVDEDAIYFCGNSLGLLNKKARKHMIEELDVWGSS
jgi:kynureninase